MPERAVARDVAVADRGDELGLDEARALLGLRPRERARLALQRLQQALHALELEVVEARADAPDVVQLAVHIDAHDERPEAARAAAVPERPAADDDLRGAEVLDLQPARRA